MVSVPISAFVSDGLDASGPVFGRVVDAGRFCRHTIVERGCNKTGIDALALLLFQELSCGAARPALGQANHCKPLIPVVTRADRFLHSKRPIPSSTTIGNCHSLPQLSADPVASGCRESSWSCSVARIGIDHCLACNACSKSGWKRPFLTDRGMHARTHTQGPYYNPAQEHSLAPYFPGTIFDLQLQGRFCSKPGH